MHIRYKFIAYILPLLLINSCLRYVPARDPEELGSEKNGDTEYLGAEAFFRLETIQRERLETLINQRNATLNLSDKEAYHIGVGDLLEFNVFDVEELNRTVRVRPSGFISMPLLGKIRAEGLTENELVDEVSTRLSKFMYTPDVNIFISEYSAQKISVIGQVPRPGTYALKRDDYSLIEVLSEAGGRGSNSDKSSGTILLVPSPKEKERLAIQTANSRNFKGKIDKSLEDKRFGIEINFDDLVGGIDRPPLIVPLRPGDTVVVPEIGKIQVDGEVKGPGSFDLTSKMSLLGAIASAGGLTYSANVEKVEVIRELGGGKKARITLDLEDVALREADDIRLRNGDVVRVPSHPGRFVTRQVVESLNSILSFGLSGGV